MVLVLFASGCKLGCFSLYALLLLCLVLRGIAINGLEEASYRHYIVVVGCTSVRSRRVVATPKAYHCVDVKIPCRALLRCCVRAFEAFIAFVWLVGHNRVDEIQVKENSPVRRPSALKRRDIAQIQIVTCPG